MSASAQLEASNKDQKELDFVLVAELGASFRARSQPEYTLTAAAVASFGALAWGVAATNPSSFVSKPFVQRPAAIAAIGTGVIAIAIALKIRREFGRYAKIKQEQSQILKRLATPLNSIDLIPKDMLTPAGPGYKGSIGVVIVAAIAGIAFCLSLSGLW